MGKRARSEDDENCGGEGLRKMHISEREVNNGVLQERKMQEVYNKTLAMLFRGTKNLDNNNLSSHSYIVFVDKMGMIIRPTSNRPAGFKPNSNQRP